jgi:hypothetical protein
MGKYYTPAQIAAHNRYNRKTYDRITLCIPKGAKERIQSLAQAQGQSMTAYILSAITLKESSN